MATGVFFHAHPDDEAIATGGTMAKAVAAGHRVVLVLATRGELGEPVPGVLRDGEELWERRVVESHRSAEILGASRVEFLGYRDSGMIGEPTNDEPSSFWQADVEVAAEQFAAILREEGADFVVVYDENGSYGHPDHIQVHRVGVAGARLAGVDRIFESTINRTAILRTFEGLEALDGATEEAVSRREAIENDPTFGTLEEHVTHAVDVQDYTAVKRAAMAAHESQIPADSMFLGMDDETFAGAFGTEWYIEHGRPRPASHPMRTEIF
jgi:LmbE family N-acetylglucosaminyl deacetylase